MITEDFFPFNGNRLILHSCWNISFEHTSKGKIIVLTNRMLTGKLMYIDLYESISDLMHGAKGCILSYKLVS